MLHLAVPDSSTHVHDQPCLWGMRRCVQRGARVYRPWCGGVCYTHHRIGRDHHRIGRDHHRIGRDHHRIGRDHHRIGRDHNTRWRRHYRSDHHSGARYHHGGARDNCRGERRPNSNFFTRKEP
jgi:hypothetical protein